MQSADVASGTTESKIIYLMRKHVTDRVNVFGNKTWSSPDSSILVCRRIAGCLDPSSNIKGIAEIAENKL